MVNFEVYRSDGKSLENHRFLPTGCKIYKQQGFQGALRPSSISMRTLFSFVHIVK